MAIYHMTLRKPGIETDHESWFKHQVELTLERIERGQARLIPHDEFWNEVETHIRDLTKRTSPEN